MPGHLVISGEKVSLYTLTREDMELIWKYYGDFEVRRFLIDGFMPVYLEDEVRWYEERVVGAKDKNVVFCVVENSKRRIVGLVGLHEINHYHGYAEIGYWLWKEYWQRGFGTETVKLMVTYGFEFLNLRKIFARVFSPNIASQRVLEKNGFRKTGKLSKHMFVPGYGYVDVIFFEKFREE